MTLDTLIARSAAGHDVGFYAGKSLVERVTGRFYTPDTLGWTLAARIADELALDAHAGVLGRSVRISDPFCGDGRLISGLLNEAAGRPALAHRHFHIVLHDIDSRAVAKAEQTVRCQADALKLRVSISAATTDSFSEVPKPIYDAIITNPPWELLKPDAREMARLGARDRAKYVAYLRERCADLDARFPEAKADKAWAGWGTNLARCGIALAIRLCRRGGVVGIVLPATLMADQASVSLRRALVDRTALLDIAVFPAEARLFAKVDQPVVAAAFRVGGAATTPARVRYFDKDNQLSSACDLSWSHDNLAARDYVLAVAFGMGQSPELQSLFSDLPRFGDLENGGSRGLWAGRELDETGLDLKLTRSGESLFVKGRMIQRHGLAEQPTMYVRPEWAERIKSRGYQRLVWRDVARASQARRMIGTVIPAGWVAGNSLHVAYFRDGDVDRLRALHSIVSSLVFELQIRSRLGTGHMSLGAVRSAHIPRLEPRLVRRLSNLAAAAMSGNTDDAVIRLEVAVAKAFGLDREAMKILVAQFPKLSTSDREKLLDARLWKGATA